METESKRGWPSGKRRKLDAPIVRRSSVGFREVDTERLQAVADHLGIEADAEAVREAIRLAHESLPGRA